MSSDHEVADHPTPSAAEEDEPTYDLSRPEVTTKYRTASDIVNAALLAVIVRCVDGADIAELCRFGDSVIDEKCSTVYNKKSGGEKPKKGTAFPTCLSVNEICGHFSPLQSESAKLKEGDVCKIDLGCHIDGFITVGAHTVVVPNSDGGVLDEADVTGRKADVIVAAWTAAQAALRTLKVGNTNTEVTRVMNLAAEQFKCNTVRGVLSHQMIRHVIDGSKVIISKETPEDKVDEFEFELNEVYAIDVLVSTADGKAKETENRTTVYKRDVSQTYKLKTQLGRKFVHELNMRFPTLPFTICAFEDEKMARVGISECLRHQLVSPYPILTEKSGEFVAQFKFTVLLLPGGAKQVTGLPFAQQSQIKSGFTVVDEGLAKLLATSMGPKTRSKKKKTPAAKVVDSPAAAEE